MSIEERLERMGCLLFTDNDEYFYYYHWISFDNKNRGVDKE